MTITTSQHSRPAFIVDHQSVDRDHGHQIDWANVPEDYRDIKGGTITLNGAVAVDATSITVDALTFALTIPPGGRNIYFGEAKEFVRVTVAAAIGATSLTVEAVPTALEDNDTAIVSGSGLKTIPASTVMGVVSSGSPVVSKMYPRVVTSNPADGLLETTAVEEDKVASLSGYSLIVGGVVYENLLIDAVAGVLPAAMKTELAANTKGFLFRAYGDSRAT